MLKNNLFNQVNHETKNVNYSFRYPIQRTFPRINKQEASQSLSVLST